MWKLIFIGLCLNLFSCQNPWSVPEAPPVKETLEGKKPRPLAFQNGKVYALNGEKYLYGGKDSSTHFKITNTFLNEDQFHYGNGRESSPALLQPEFISLEEADALWSDTSRFLLAYAGNEVKAYSVKDLTHHEVVNDSLNGMPIMAAYCVLADYGGIYNRRYGGQTLTFALSGYTYYDENILLGLDGFILWDRETESLWWPLINKAVSGPLINVPLQKLPARMWSDLTWAEIKANYPNVQVLKSGQDLDPPDAWDQEVDLAKIRSVYN